MLWLVVNTSQGGRGIPKHQGSSLMGPSLSTGPTAALAGETPNTRIRALSHSRPTLAAAALVSFPFPSLFIPFFCSPPANQLQLSACSYSDLIAVRKVVSFLELPPDAFDGLRTSPGPKVKGSFIYLSLHPEGAVSKALGSQGTSQGSISGCC